VELKKPKFTQRNFNSLIKLSASRLAQIVELESQLGRVERGKESLSTAYHKILEQWQELKNEKATFADRLNEVAINYAASLAKIEQLTELNSKRFSLNYRDGITKKDLAEKITALESRQKWLIIQADEYMAIIAMYQEEKKASL